MANVNARVGKLNDDNEVRDVKWDNAKWDTGGPEGSDSDEILPQQVTYYDLSVRHVHWDRVTMAVLAFGAVVFWAWGQHQNEFARSTTNIENLLPKGDGIQQHPETVALAALPQNWMQTTPRASLSFIDPAPESTVGATLTVRGIVRGVQADKHLWLITRREPQLGFWPKERIVPDADGRFEQTTWDYGPDGRMSVCLLATTADDTERFDEWLSVGDREDEWPSVQPITSRSTLLGCQEVRLVKR